MRFKIFYTIFLWFSVGLHPCTYGTGFRSVVNLSLGLCVFCGMPLKIIDSKAVIDGRPRDNWFQVEEFSYYGPEDGNTDFERELLSLVKIEKRTSFEDPGKVLSFSEVLRRELPNISEDIESQIIAYLASQKRLLFGDSLQRIDASFLRNWY